MKIYIEKDDKLLELKKNMTGLELLKELNINPNTVIIVRNNEVILSEEKLSETDDVKIISVVSGG